MNKAQRPKLLVVDDTPENITLLFEALKRDYALMAARDGATALRLIDNDKLPELILLDIMMPDMDGFEVCRRLKANPATAQIPIIFITGLTDEKSELKGLELGAVDYIHKPFSVPLVRARVANLIQQNNLRQQLSIYAAAFTNASDGMLITLPDGTITVINPAFEKATGYTPEDMLGQTPSILKSDIQSEAFYQSMWAHLKKSGNWNGEIWNCTKGGSVIPERLSISAILDDQGKVKNYLAVYTDISAEKEREKVLMNKATRDSLTGLPNRTLFNDRLELAINSCAREDKQYALLFVDLDHFKPINDQHGHEMGDEVLRQVAQRMKECLRRNDTLARYGGDEFVILSQVTADEDAKIIAHKIIQALNQPFLIDGLELGLGCSIGISFSCVESEGEALIRRADKLMYQAKLSGKNRFQIDEPAS